MTTEEKKEFIKKILDGTEKLCTHGDGKFLIGQTEPIPVLFCTKCQFRIV